MTIKKERIVLLVVALMFAAMLAIAFSDSANAATTKYKLSNVTKPTCLYEGSSFIVDGIVRSNKKIYRISVGIANADGTFMKGYYKSYKPGTTYFELAEADKALKFGSLKKGTYKYLIVVTDSSKTKKKIVNKTFYVEKFSTSGISKPESILYGHSFKITGKVSSQVNLKYVRVGIKDGNMNWVSGQNAVVSPKTTSYDLSKLDSKISFGSLAEGKYYYCVKLTNTKGVANTVVEVPFEVTKTISPDTDMSILTDEEFTRYLKSQGFTASYRKLLNKLHAKHPKWVFIGQNTKADWSYIIEKESVSGVSLVKDSADKKYRSTTNKNKYDGGSWYQASDATIAYFIDPRNYLTESLIYAFIGHTFDANYQTKTTIKKITSKYGDTYCAWNTTTYINYLYKAGEAANVNPNVLTSMLIMEQGWKGGTAITSGNFKGYEGIYNYFNIGAWNNGLMTATERGLWYANGGTSKVGGASGSYGRPWNTKYKAFKGGALFYYDEYIDNNQNTYYLKKFNVMNAASTSFTNHQYMTNVMGVSGEASLVSYAYSGEDIPCVFYIPLYKNMPTDPCPEP